MIRQLAGEQVQADAAQWPPWTRRRTKITTKSTLLVQDSNAESAHALVITGPTVVPLSGGFALSSGVLISGQTGVAFVVDNSPSVKLTRVCLSWHEERIKFRIWLSSKQLG